MPKKERKGKGIPQRKATEESFLKEKEWEGGNLERKKVVGAVHQGKGEGTRKGIPKSLVSFSFLKELSMALWFSREPERCSPGLGPQEVK